MVEFFQPPFFSPIYRFSVLCQQPTSLPGKGECGGSGLN
jgi:hypothetical protein